MGGQKQARRMVEEGGYMIDRQMDHDRAEAALIAYQAERFF